MAGGKQRDPDHRYLPLETILSKEYAAFRLDQLQMAPPKEAAFEGVYPASNHVTAVDAAGNVATILHSSMALPWANALFVEGVSIVPPDDASRGEASSVPCAPPPIRASS